MAAMVLVFKHPTDPHWIHPRRFGVSQKHLLQSDTARKINPLLYPKNIILSFAGALHHYLPLLDSNPPVRKKNLHFVKILETLGYFKGFCTQPNSPSPLETTELQIHCHGGDFIIASFILALQLHRQPGKVNPNSLR